MGLPTARAMPINQSTEIASTRPMAGIGGTARPASKGVLWSADERRGRR